MKKLILVRHGHYKGGHLTEKGQQQIIELGNTLKTKVSGEHIMILTSIADRAFESADILGQILDSSVEVEPALSSIESEIKNLSGVLKIVRSRKDNVDTLVLVTHMEFVQRFPTYFIQTEFGVDRSLSDDLIVEDGQGVVIDCDRKAVEIVP